MKTSKMTYAKFCKLAGIDPKDTEIGWSWVTGGMTGGGYLDGSPADQPVSPEPPPSSTPLDEILEKVCPTIPFLAYRTLCGKLIRNDEYTDREYYGNYTVCAKQYFDPRKLYEYLVNNNLLEPHRDG